MARSLVLGNGNMLVGYDEWAQVRDLHFPHVGLENHVGEPLVHRIGVFVDGKMYWFSDGGFTIRVSYESDTLVARVHVRHDVLKLEFHFSDIVYNEHNIYVRHIEVVNLADVDRNIKLFFNQQFQISGYARGDTGYYSPELHAIIHYKGRRVFLVSAQSDDAFFDDYSVGLLGIEGKEGTWRDAEDGVLQKSGIEHGSVDSVIGVSLFLRAKGVRTVSYWVAAGPSYRHVKEMHHDILKRSPEHLLRTTRDYWRAWVAPKKINTCDVAPDLVALYHTSLLTMRVHTDNESGAIIASGDSSILQSGRDTYNYCWPRDAAYIVLAFLHAGHLTASRKFHGFVREVLTADGYLLHKYRSDKSLGSSWHSWVYNGRAQPPIQEDETAITLITLGKHYEKTQEVELIEDLYNPYIKPVADFLAKYRDKKTGLPSPSHDLWEEQLGVFTYTASCVYGALKQAAYFASLLGKEVAHTRWSAAADQVRMGVVQKLIEDDGRVLKQLHYTNMGVEKDFTVDASSFYGLFKFNVLDVDDPRLVFAYEQVKQHLSVKKCGDSIARYEGDNYFKTAHDVPGNPWVVTTLWLAEFEIARAKSARELAVAYERLMWVCRVANNAGLLSEQYDGDTCSPVSVTPLAWSHAQYVTVFLMYIEKMKTLKLCKQS